jgi:uncharacterized repeat protein (TIGR01451 family)
MNRAKGAFLAAAVAVLALSGAAAANTPAPVPPAFSPHSTPHNVMPEGAVRQVAKHARSGTARTRPTQPLPPRPHNARGVGRLPADAPNDLATAIEATGQTFVGSASFVTSPLHGTPDAVSDTLDPEFLGPGFPTDGSNFAVLTSGDANLAATPNTASNSGADDSCTLGIDENCGAGGDPTSKGANRTEAHDVTILKIPLTVPAGKSCLSFDYRFLSEEFPEWVGTPFNDAFIAELDTNSWTATGSSAVSPISAPKNFAFDPVGRPVSINAAGTSSMAPGPAFDTTYDGATPILTASTPITAGAHVLYLSIFDQGDHILDSAAFVDNLRLSSAKCSAGSVPNEQPADVSVAVDGTSSDTGVGYSLVVKNNGPAPADHVTLTDLLPDPLTLDGEVSSSEEGCSGFTSSVTCTFDELPAGAVVDINFSADSPPGTYSNTAQVTTSSFDPLLANNQSTKVNGVGDGGIPLVDLALAKSGPPTATQGDVVDYQLAITNLGPDNFDSGITVTDQLPKSLYLLGGSVGAEDPPEFDGCFISDPKTNTAECDFEPGFTLETGDTVTIDFYVYVTGKGAITNSASVDTWFPTNDPNPANNTSSTSMNVAAATTPTGDVVLTKTVNPLLAQSGNTLTYTITVTNKGSKELSEVDVSDSPDVGTTDVSVTDTLSQCTELDPPGFDCTLDLLAGKSDKITYVVTMNDSALGYASNYAVAFPDAYFDPNYANNFAWADTKVGPGDAQVSDLVAQVTGLPKSVGVSGIVTATLRVTNTGPGPIDDALVGLVADYGDGTILGVAPGCDFDLASCDLGPLAKGASKSVTVSWIAPSYPSTYPFGAYAFSLDGTWVDTNIDNNLAYTTVDVTQPTSDLTLTETDATDPVINGSNETYTLKVANLGPDPATVVQVVDGLPEGETLVSTTATGATCAGATVLTCTLKSSLAKGASTTITIIATVNDENSLPDTVTNAATVSTESLDPHPESNLAAASTTVNVPNADVSITGSGSPDPVLTGGKVAYTFTVLSNGPLPAPTPTLRYHIPDGWTFVSAAGPGTCSLVGTVDCHMKTLNPKQSAKFTITVTTPLGVDTPLLVLNTATVSSPLADMLSGNNSVTVPTSLNPPNADLVLTGSAPTTPVAKGALFSYKFTVKNNGPLPATGTTLTVDLPDAVTLPKLPTGCTGSGTLTCTIGTLAKGASKVFTITVKAPNTPNTTLTAQGSTTSSVADLNGPNNEAEPSVQTKSDG